MKRRRREATQRHKKLLQRHTTRLLWVIAVCVYRLVMISIERSETGQKSTLEIRDKFSLRQNAVQDKFQSENFFLMVGIFFFFRLNFVSDCIFFGLNLSQTEFCLRLNFVSHYIPQLYFVCNHLIVS